MQSNKTVSLPVYTLWFVDETPAGTAEQLLERIRRAAAKTSAEIKKLTTDEYASRIVDDAASFLPANMLAFLRKQPYPSDYDRALRYLSEMPNSGVRILSRKDD